MSRTGRATRRRRHIYPGRKYPIVPRLPGGGEFDRGFAETRQRAFKVAQQVNRPQTRPTAGAVNYDADADLQSQGYLGWKLNGDNDIIVY